MDAYIPALLNSAEWPREPIYRGDAYKKIFHASAEPICEISVLSPDAFTFVGPIHSNQAKSVLSRLCGRMGIAPPVYSMRGIGTAKIPRANCLLTWRCYTPSASLFQLATTNTGRLHNLLDNSLKHRVVHDISVVGSHRRQRDASHVTALKLLQDTQLMRSVLDPSAITRESCSSEEAVKRICRTHNVTIAKSKTDFEKWLTPERLLRFRKYGVPIDTEFVSRWIGTIQLYCPNITNELNVGDILLYSLSDMYQNHNDLPRDPFPPLEWLPKDFVDLLEAKHIPKIGVGIASDTLVFKRTFNIHIPPQSVCDMSLMLRHLGIATGCSLKHLSILLLGFAPRKLKSDAMSQWLQPVTVHGWLLSTDARVRYAVLDIILIGALANVLRDLVDKRHQPAQISGAINTVIDSHHLRNFETWKLFQSHLINYVAEPGQYFIRGLSKAQSAIAHRTLQRVGAQSSTVDSVMVINTFQSANTFPVPDQNTHMLLYGCMLTEVQMLTLPTPHTDISDDFLHSIRIPASGKTNLAPILANVDMIVDTGAGVSIIQSKLFNALFPHPVLHPSRSTMTGFNGSESTSIGLAEVPFTMQGRAYTHKFRVMPDMPASSQTIFLTSTEQRLICNPIVSNFTITDQS